MEPTQQCPWDGLRAWGGPPNVDWCEETLCRWDAEPANTWSNLAFLGMAVVLYALSRRETSRTLRFFPTVAFWVGITSLVYHASVAFVTQVFDFFGMYFFFVLVVLLNLVRVGTLPKARLFQVLWPLIVAFTVLTVVVAKVGLPVQAIIGVLLGGAIVTELIAARRERGQGFTSKFFIAAIVTIAIAAAFSASDVSRRFCDPQDHVVQGHAIWHLLSSGALLLSYVHYRQFRERFT